MKCKFCQREITQDMEICSYCRNPVPKTNKKPLLIGIIIGLCIAIVVAAVALTVAVIKKRNEGVTLFYSDGRRIEVSKDEVNSYKEQGWMGQDEYENLIATFLETPYFGLDDDISVRCDDNTESIIFMTYSDFKEKFGDEILYESSVEDGMYDVVTADATFTFMDRSYTSNDKDDFQLSGVKTESNRFTFGRGIKVGMKISKLDEILPTTKIPNGYYVDCRYLFDENLEPCETIPAGGTLIYRSTEIWNDLELLVGWEDSGCYATMEITQKNGVITEIAYGIW